MATDNGPNETRDRTGGDKDNRSDGGFSILRRWLSELPTAGKWLSSLIGMLSAVGFVLSIFWPEWRKLVRDAVFTLPPEVLVPIIIFLAVATGFLALLVYSGILSTKKNNEEIEELEEDNKRYLKERQDITTAQEHIWGQRVGDCPSFMPTRPGRAKIVSLINLKGGVGKTTITANLGRALVERNEDLKVLLIDLDFQRSLSRICIDPESLNFLTNQKNTTSAKLLNPDLTPADFLELPVQTPTRPSLHVIISDVELEYADYQAQADFFVDPADDPRFRFRRLLHTPEVLKAYDFILMDCPPRATTSAINAIGCSHYVIIPARPNQASIIAVPHTLNWLNTLDPIHQAQCLGVVINEVDYHGGRPIKQHRQQIEELRQRIARYDAQIFDAMIKDHSSISGPGSRPGQDAGFDALEYFGPLAAEFLQKVNDHEHR